MSLEKIPKEVAKRQAPPQVDSETGERLIARLREIGVEWAQARHEHATTLDKAFQKNATKQDKLENAERLSKNNEKTTRLSLEAVKVAKKARAAGRGGETAKLMRGWMNEGDRGEGLSFAVLLGLSEIAGPKGVDESFAAALAEFADGGNQKASTAAGVEQRAGKLGLLAASVFQACAAGQISGELAAKALLGLGALLGVDQTLSRSWQHIGDAAGDAMAQTKWNPRARIDELAVQAPSAFWAALSHKAPETLLSWGMRALGEKIEKDQAARPDATSGRAMSDANASVLFIGCAAIARGFDETSRKAWEIEPQQLAQVWTATTSNKGNRSWLASIWVNSAPWPASWAQDAGRRLPVESLDTPALVQLLEKDPGGLTRWGESIFASFEAQALRSFAALDEEASGVGAAPPAIASKASSRRL